MRTIKKHLCHCDQIQCGILSRANQRSLDEKRDKLRKYKKSSSSSKSASPSLPSEPPEENTNLVKRVSFQVVDPVPDQSALVDIEIRPPPAPDAEDRESRSPSLPPSLEEISPEEEQQGEPPLE